MAVLFMRAKICTSGMLITLLGGKSPAKVHAHVQSQIFPGYKQSLLTLEDINKDRLVRNKALEEEVNSMQDTLAQREIAVSEEQALHIVNEAAQQEEGIWEDEVFSEPTEYCEKH